MAFAVRVSGPEMSRAIQAIALDYGYSWNHGNDIQDLNAMYLLFNYSKPKAIQCIEMDSVWIETKLKEGRLTKVFYCRDEIEEIVKELAKGEKKTWIINGHEAKIEGENLVVGCAKVPFSMVKEIYEAFKEIYDESRSLYQASCFTPQNFKN